MKKYKVNDIECSFVPKIIETDGFKRPLWRDGQPLPDSELETLGVEIITIPEPTPAEIEAAKLARTHFTQDEILNACESLDTKNDNTVMVDKLKTVLENAEFNLYWNTKPEIDLIHSVTQAAMSAFTQQEINSLKLEIN